MKQMTKAETESALRDPWRWCLAEIKRRNLTSAALAVQTGLARSTCRALYSGRNQSPKYTALMVITNHLLNTRDEKPASLPDHKNAGSMPSASYL